MVNFKVPTLPDAKNLFQYVLVLAFGAIGTLFFTLQKKDEASDKRLELAEKGWQAKYDRQERRFEARQDSAEAKINRLQRELIESFKYYSKAQGTGRKIKGK